MAAWPSYRDIVELQSQNEIVSTQVWAILAVAIVLLREVQRKVSTPACVQWRVVVVVVAKGRVFVALCCGVEEWLWPVAQPTAQAYVSSRPRTI